MAEAKIDVAPATPEALQELLDAVRDTEDMFPDVLERTIAGLQAGADPDWGTRVFIDQKSGRVLGYGGFTGPPTDGVVELGYSVVPDARGRGVATAAARAMVEEARARGCRACVAHTLPEENASTTVLERNGFVRDGEDIDPDEGEVWRWKIDLT